MEMTITGNKHRAAPVRWQKEKLWNGLLGKTARAAHLQGEETEKLAGSAAAELIAATAYLSGCREPERIAVSHLTIFLASLRCRDVFDHRPGESLAARLAPVAYYPGGDEASIRACLVLLELISLNDHKHDLAADILAGKQNPLITELDYGVQKERLLGDWQALPGEVRELFLPFYDRAIRASFWF